ncbi:MAG: S-DNA-T family DNA segregation ATPase FtsK/SpoIIIE [Limisphaerales bacterium]|jgi:S-DNA-T family DNA segregation ATPase FtsK/SpoIIIE
MRKLSGASGFKDNLMANSVTSNVLPMREIGILALATTAAFLVLAIASYSPTDAAFSYSAATTDADNLVGTLGAYFSDLVLYFLGWVAYLIPVAFGVIGVRLLLNRSDSVNWLFGLVRSTGWLCLLVSTTILFALHSSNTGELPAGPGGVFGQWLSTHGSTIFGLVGLTVLSVAGALIGLQAATGLSWLDVSEATGRILYRIYGVFLLGYDKLADQIKERRHKHLDRKNSRVAIIPPPNNAPTEKRTVDKRNSKKTTPTIFTKAKEPARPASQKRLFQPEGIGELPDLDLLDEKNEDQGLGYSADSLEAMSRQLELKLADFNVDAQVVSVLPGPVVTRFEIQPAPGVKVQKISSLAKDLARSLAVISVRIVEVIPGKSVVGIEIPNEHREMVQLKEVINSQAFQSAASPLTLAMGKDIAGVSIVADIAKMPHLLVAGTTGSGKSVGVNAMILSILCKATPEEVRLILVDPKMLELSVYEGIPHLLAPVVTDMKEAAHALNWCVAEMERRYRLMAAMGVRNLAGFNRQVREAKERKEPLLDPLWTDELEPAPALEHLPAVVVVIDEFADMMMVVGKKVEQLIARIAQKARAAGIHLVLATQRPSVDVITGLIKANIPARIGFQVSSKIDSRTILDQGGAEQLLGHGDMLFLPPGTALPQRIHGAFVSDEEVHRIVDDWKRRGAPEYVDAIVNGSSDGEAFVQLDGDENAEQEDELYDEAVQFVLESRRASISSVQRKLRIGYNRAARLVEAMEVAGIVSSMGTNGSREILVPNREH